MGLVVFTATLSVLAEHADGESVELEIEFSECVRSREVRKHPHRASAGALETLYEGADTVWDIDLAPTYGDQATRIKEFLDSTGDGQTFLIYIYGTEAAPISVKRKDSGYSLQPFQRTGVMSIDTSTTRITVIEQ